MIAKDYMSVSRSSLSRGWWRDWGALLTIGNILLIAALVLFLLFPRGSAEQRTLITDLAYIPITAVPAILAWRVSRHPSLEQRTRKGWKLLSAGYAAWFVASLLWFYYEIILQTAPFPSWADAGYLGIYPFVLCGLLYLRDSKRQRTETLKFWLDTLAVLLGGGMLIWYLIILPTILVNYSTSLEAGLALAYPVGDLILLFGIATLLLSGTSPRTRTPLALLVVGLLAFFVADLGFGYTNLQNTYETGDWPDTFYAITFLFLTCSAHWQYRNAALTHHPDAAPALPVQVISLLPYGAVVVGFGLLVYVAHPQWSHPVGSLIIGAVALTGVVVARQVVADRMVRQSEARFRSLVQNSSDVIMVLNPYGVPSYVSASMERVMGYQIERVLGQPLSEWIHPEDVELLHQFLADSVARPRTPGDIELRYQHADGTWRFVQIVASSMLDDPAVGGVVVNAWDITERRRAQETLVGLAGKLQRSNRELQDFASVASHDLQEPLRKVTVFGERLRTRYSSTLDETGQDYIDRMQNAARRMQTLIEDLLAFSRVSTKAKPFVPVDLAQVAREVLADLDVRIDQTNARVEVDELPTLEAEPLHMRQLLQNLIGNALKFRRPGEAPVVKVYARRLNAAPMSANGNVPDGQLYEIMVQDNGIGFEEKYLDRIFAPFQRLHGRDAYEGTGMGLAVCRKIAEYHCGSITASSQPGSGTTFRVTLPVTQPHEGDR